MSNLGMGVMINMLGGNESTVTAIKNSLGKKIERIQFCETRLTLEFQGSKLLIYDDGQSCCETRYMTCDDNLEYHHGSTFLNIEVADAPCVADKYEVHEVQFLKITTSNGGFTVETHNEHNGCYGGFWIVAQELREAQR